MLPIYSLRISRSSFFEPSQDRPRTVHSHCFYFNGVPFVHKRNPLQAVAGTKSRIWRKKNEGLQFAAKGSKDLAGGPQLHLLVAITNGKGVVLEEVYEKMDGQFFTQFIQTHFNIAFARSGPKWHRQLLFIMDNDPCQQSKVAKRALVSGDKKTCCHICQQWKPARNMADRSPQGTCQKGKCWNIA